MNIEQGLRALISAAWQLDEVVLPLGVLEALETGRSLYLGELLEAADAMGVKVSDLAESAQN